MKKKQQKEFTQMLSSIRKWHLKNKGDVCFVGSFVAFDSKKEVGDSAIIGFGCKNCIKLSLDEIKDNFKKEKSDFINW